LLFEYPRREREREISLEYFGMDGKDNIKEI
jgi:hypothetical protein